MTADPPDPGRRERLRTVLAACLGWLFSAMDIVLLLILRKQIEADLHVSSQAMEVAIGVGLASSALGAVVFAQLGDRYGRVRALTWAILLYSIGTCAMSLSWDAWSLCGFRALSGIGTGGEWSLGFALVAEVWRSDKRGTIGGLVQSMFNVGTLVAVFLSIGLMDHWRLVFALAAAPALVVLWIRSRVPESRLWLRLQEARRTGEVPPDLEHQLRRPPLRALFEGPLARVTVLGALVFTLMNFAFYGFGSQIIPFLTATPENGGLGWTLKQAGPVNLSVTVVAGLASALAGMLSDRIGRRHVFSAVCALGAAAFVVLYFVISDLDPARPGPFWAAVVFAGAAFGINGIVGALFSEIYPTHLRATGPGFVSNMGKFVSAVGPWLAGWLVATGSVSGGARHGWAVALAFPAVCYAALALLIWALPRVTGRPLAAVEHAEHLRSR